MKLLFLQSSSDLYGASKILIAVTQLCKARGHEVTVVLSEDGPLAAALTEIGAEVIFLDLGILRRRYMNPAGLFDRTTTIFKAYRQLKKICRERKTDLIYSNTTGVVVGTWVARSLGIPHIWHVHEIIEKPALLFRGLSYLLNQRQNRVLVVSEAVKKHWTKHVSSDKVTVLYNGVDHWLFPPGESSFRAEQGIPADAVVVGMMGRVHFWKGQDYFFRIAGFLHRQFPGTVFVSVGDAFPGYEYLYDKLNAIITEEGLSGAVKQVHYRQDIANIYRSFDLFVLPSLLPDPAPAVVTEAMASGLPVVVTRQGGALEMIEENISGLVIPINEPEAAAAIIAPLLADAGKRRRMGEAARQRILDHFSREIFNQKIIDFIEQA